MMADRGANGLSAFSSSFFSSGAGAGPSLFNSAAMRPRMGNSWVSLLNSNFSCRSRWMARVGTRRTLFWY